MEMKWLSTRNCNHGYTWKKAYTNGYRDARFPVPAIPVSVGYQPTGQFEMKGVSYIWIATIDMLWTFWSEHGLIEEWLDSEGHHHMRDYT